MFKDSKRIVIKKEKSMLNKYPCKIIFHKIIFFDIFSSLWCKNIRVNGKIVNISLKETNNLVSYARGYKWYDT